MQINKLNKWTLLATVMFSTLFGSLSDSHAADKKLNLVDAVMCESIRDLAPVNKAAVFSIATGKVSCFSSFDPVPRQTFIYHHWYHRGELSTKKKLFLKPPSWSTYSSIQLREADKGPWRVDITNDKGTIFATQRFSVTD